jgi:hypothetical protein
LGVSIPTLKAVFGSAGSTNISFTHCDPTLPGLPVALKYTGISLSTDLKEDLRKLYISGEGYCGSSSIPIHV